MTSTRRQNGKTDSSRNTGHCYRDEKSLSFLPEEAKIGLQEALTACEEDAQREAEASPRLKELAEENLQSIITALTYPLLNREEEPYQIIWN